MRFPYWKPKNADLYNTPTGPRIKQPRFGTCLLEPLFQLSKIPVKCGVSLGDQALREQTPQVHLLPGVRMVIYAGGELVELHDSWPPHMFLLIAGYCWSCSAAREIGAQQQYHIDPTTADRILSEVEWEELLT